MHCWFLWLFILSAQIGFFLLCAVVRCRNNAKHVSWLPMENTPNGIRPMLVAVGIAILIHVKWFCRFSAPEFIFKRSHKPVHLFQITRIHSCRCFFRRILFRLRFKQSIKKAATFASKEYRVSTAVAKQPSVQQTIKSFCAENPRLFIFELFMETIRWIHNRVHTLLRTSTYFHLIFFFSFRLVWGALNAVPEHERRIIALDGLLLILIIVNIATTRCEKNLANTHRASTFSEVKRYGDKRENHHLEFNFQMSSPHHPLHPHNIFLLVLLI